MLDFRYDCSYTVDMKTAISLPDQLFEEAEETAQYMGLPRSQLFAKALEEFIQNHNSARITEKLNSVYEKLQDKEGDEVTRLGVITIRELTKNDTW